MEFSDRIMSLEELRAVIPSPNGIVANKEVDQLDEYCRDFISRSPFVLIASTDGMGSIDVSPKGDPPGLVKVLDATTLAIPDRPGNHRADTFVNILGHPFVGLIFLIPGTRNTLRVRGTATIVRDADLLDSMAIDGRVPQLALVVSITSAFFHCAKCIIRSGLWEGEARDTSDSDALFLAETMVKHGELSLTVDEMREVIINDEVRRLY
ncbi:MAG: pyridoxamine 5'-phosphate oxidase family protein [Acidimicrobiia bacterium]|nr:pyridoxamine 5'-phosphate oxidase family protein [Actinomycetota bacterium]MBL6926802.1 pyridoxamine 5'-phosphate oxidase family protein [Acidimicrobiia bacterium]